jgi:hypothetical protein
MRLRGLPKQATDPWNLLQIMLAKGNELDSSLLSRRQTAPETMD